MTSTADILIVVGCTDGAPEKGFYDTLAFVERLRGLQPGTAMVLLLGEDVAAAARQIATVAGLDVAAICADGLATHTCEAYRQVLVAEIEALQPTYVCTPHTSRGMEWAPAIAAEVGGDCISGVDGLECMEDKICFQKELYGGKVKGRFAPAAATTFLTIQPGVFKSEGLKADNPGKVLEIRVDCSLKTTHHLGIVPSQGGGADISEAKIIVAAGNGIGSEENLALIRQLADLFPHAAVAGTRLVCDRGWLDYQQQVGVTGTTVAPALYIACGISGATQHRVGMRGAQFVVAINTDPDAPMFNEADICIVEDLTEFIPLVLALHS